MPQIPEYFFVPDEKVIDAQNQPHGVLSSDEEYLVSDINSNAEVAAVIKDSETYYLCLAFKENNYVDIAEAQNTAQRYNHSLKWAEVKKGFLILTFEHLR
jgi:hypothetical protein